MGPRQFLRENLAPADIWLKRRRRENAQAKEGHQRPGESLSDANVNYPRNPYNTKVQVFKIFKNLNNMEEVNKDSKFENQSSSSASSSKVFQSILTKLFCIVTVLAHSSNCLSFGSVSNYNLFPDTLWRISTTTVDMMPTYISPLYVFCRHYTYSNANRIWIINRNVGQTAAANPGYTWTGYTFLCASKDDLVVHGSSEIETYFYRVQMNTVASTFSMSLLSTTAGHSDINCKQYAIGGSVKDPTTSYIYVPNVYTCITRIDTSIRVYEPLCNGISGSYSPDYGYIKGLEMLDSDKIVFVTDRYISVIMKATLNTLHTFDFYSAFSLHIRYLITDPVMPVYHLSTSGNHLWSIQRCYDNGPQGTCYIKRSATGAYDRCWDSLLVLGKFNILVASSTTTLSNNLHFFRTHDLVLLDTVATTDYTTMFSMQYAGYENRETTTTRFTRHFFAFAYLSGGYTYASTRQVDITTCTSISPTTGKCLTCNTGEFLAPAMINSNQSTCDPVGSFPSGYGYSTTYGLMTKCKADGCALCYNTDYCMVCDPGYWMFFPGGINSIWSSSGGTRCYNDTALFPVAQGPVLGQVVPILSACTVSYCHSCPFLNTICAKCQPGYGVDSGTNTCLSLAGLAINSAKGLNWATDLIEACTEPSCVSCRLNNSYCDFCYGDVNRVTYFGKCIFTYELPLGQGQYYTASPTPAYLAKNCTSHECYNCSSDATKCQACVVNVTNSFTGFEYHYQTVLDSNNLCVYPYQLPNGIGANWANYQTASCSDSNCLNCALDYTKCRICNSGLTPTPYLYNNACIPLSAAPAGYGGYSGNYSLMPCQVAYCLTCANDYKICQTCDSSLTPPRYQYGGLCVTSAELPAYYGGDSATGQSASCADANCWYCRYDYQTCTLCKASYYMHGGVCTAAASLPDGFGADTILNISQPCLDANCLRCQNNYATGCSACKPGTSPQTYFLSSECLVAGKLPDGKGGNSATYVATTCSDTACIKCQNDYTVCTACSSPKYLYNGACLASTSLPNGYGAGPSNTAYPCAELGCEDCNANYSVCLSCLPTPTYYYYHSPNKSCLLENQIPNGYGAKNVSGHGQTATCSIPACTSCQIDYTTCGICASNNPPYWVYNGACTLQPSLPNGYGGDSATGYAMPCADSNCQDCRSNFQICVTCKTLTPPVYLHNLTGNCYLVADIPDGYGANLVTKLTQPCTTTNCTNCRTVYTTCTACNSTGSYPNYLLNGNCYLEYTIPYGYGTNNLTYLADACQSNLCQNCSRNPASCQQCKMQSPDLYLHFDGSINVCLTTAQMPATYGAETSSYTTRPCSVSGCQTCADNFMICTSCSPTASPTLYFHQGSCRTAPLLPDPFGANSVTKVATVCSSSRCVSCKGNYKYCDACTRTNPETFRVATTGICVTKEEIPNGLGPDYSTYEVRSCLDSKCRVCNDNYLQCKVCNTNQGQLYSANFTCLTISQIPSGYGCDNSTYTAKPCQSSGCKDCLYDYTKCVTCIDAPENPMPANPKYYWIEDRCDVCNTDPLHVIDYTCRRLCTDSSCIISLRSTRFTKSRKQVKAQFSNWISLNASAPLKLRLEAPANGINRDLEPQEYDISIINDVMLITLTIKEAEAGGTLYLDRVRSEENPIRGVGNDLAFFDYPIKWDNIYLLSSTTQKTLQSAAGASSTTTASAKAIAQLLVITKSSNIAKIPDMMVSNMIYLQLMNGETYLYPTLVFGFFANSYLPFIDLSNPFDPDYRDQTCLVPPKFYELELDCGILPNYGIDVLIIYCTLAINIVLSLIHYAIYGAKLKLYKIHKDKVNVEKMEKSVGYKISSFINESYGMKMSLVKLDGTVVEVLFYSALTITSQPISTLKYGFSAMVAFSLIAYYLWSLYYYVRLIIYISPGLEKVRKIEEERKKTEGSKYQPHQLSHYVDFTRVKYGLVGYQIEDYRADIPQAYLYAPLVWFLRCVFINMFLIGGTNMKSGQYFMYIIIEAIYLYYLTKSKVKASKYENWLTYFNEACQIAYVFLQAISYYSSDVDFKQKQIGLCQAILLGAVMAINIGYTFAVFFWQVLIQPIVRRCKKKSTDKKALLNEDQLNGKEERKDTEEKKKLVNHKFVVSTFRHILKQTFDNKGNNKPDAEMTPQKENGKMLSHQKIMST